MVIAGMGAVFLYNPSCCSGNSALLLGFTLSSFSYLFPTGSLNKKLEGQLHSCLVEAFGQLECF